MNVKACIVVYVLILFFGANISANEKVIKRRLKLKDGEIEGRKARSIDKGKIYYSFQGIPYAEPPVGDLRFADPQPPKKWNTVLDATKPGKTCIEMYFENRGYEDCLYLNVYTPALNKSLPVMVWIHGGGFTFIYTNNTLSGVDFFMDEEVIFVTVHYRLGPFGFLSTEDDVIPGNFGLKDQVTAINWVHDNIKAFGGDPSKITLMGQSAGAACTGYLGMAPQLKGKISGIIQQSGSAISSFSLGRYRRLGAYVLSTSLGLQSQNSSAILEYLRTVDHEQLRKKALTTSIDVLYGTGAFHGLLYIPGLESRSNKNSLLTEMTYEQLKSGNFNKIPRMMGLTSLEGIFLVNEFTTNREWYQNYDNDVTRYIPISMNTRNEKVGHLIKKYYTNDTPFTSNISNMVHYGTVEHFIRPSMKDAVLVSKYAKTYFYQFSYEGKLGYPQERPLKGVDHGEELGYLFYDKNQGQVDEKDKLVRYKLVRLWSNFAKYGNPTPKKEDLLDNQIWLPIDHNKNDVDYLDIGNKLTPSANLHQNDVVFWDNLYEEYGNPPYDVY